MFHCCHLFLGEHQLEQNWNENTCYYEDIQTIDSLSQFSYVGFNCVHPVIKIAFHVVYSLVQTHSYVVNSFINCHESDFDRFESMFNASSVFFKSTF